MSIAAAPSLAPEVLDYLQAWAKSITESEPNAGKAACEAVFQIPASAPALADTDVWIKVTYAGDLAGELVFRLDSRSARWLTQMSTAATDGAISDLSPEDKMAWLEWFRRVAASVSGQIERLSGIELQVDFCATPTEPSAVVFWIQGQATDTQFLSLELRLDDALLQILKSADLPLSAVQPATSQDTAARLGMLMGVELAATLRFGGKRMLLKDVLELCVGSVLELDQQLEEPVDLLLDGRLIARGEVVVVDGNYGLKVTDVLGSVNG